MLKSFLLVLLMGVVGSRPVVAGLLVNGDFQTGGFSGWTLYTTPSGVAGLGFEGLPAVAPFDTTGSGASLAAQFNVGQIDHFASGTTQEGGGIFQNIVTGAGILALHADIATFFDCQGICSGNGDAGRYALMLDGIELTSTSLGDIGTPQILRSSLDASAGVGAGVHEIRIQITRGFQAPGSIGGSFEMAENVDNVSVTLSPEPGSLVLLVLGGMVLKLRRGIRL